MYHLQAEDKEDLQRWMTTLSRAIELWKKSRVGSPQAAVEEKSYREGYLYDYSMLYGWKKQYFILKDGIFFRFRNKGEAQNGRIVLYEAKLESYRPDIEDSAFKIVSKSGKTFTLKADNQQEMTLWVNAILRQQLMIEDFLSTIQY